MLPIPHHYQTKRTTGYELTGRIDVITSLALNNPAHRSNMLVQYILATLNQEVAQGRLRKLPQDFEVIIDYKGSRRPPITAPGRRATDYWKVYGWQLRTYAHIRDHQPGSLPVVLGVVIYLNELFPSWDDLKQLRDEIANRTTDVIPTQASADWRIIQMREPPRKSLARKKNREISWDFRMRRALRLEPVYETQVLEAMTRFDRYVRVIEICRAKEALWGSILSAWPKNTSDPGTCRACDYQTFCPRYRSGFASPTLPSV